MKSDGTGYGIHWNALLEQLASLAPDPGSRLLCQHLRPAWEHNQVEALHQQTRQMQSLVASGLKWPELPQQANWIKPLLAHPGAKSDPLRSFLQAISSLRNYCEQHQKQCKSLWLIASELQIDSALNTLAQHKTLSKEAHQLLSQRQKYIKQQQDILARLGLIYTRAVFGQRHAACLPKIGKALQLKNWVPYSLDHAQALDFVLEKEIQTLIISGVHKTGKTRLLHSLYLACLMFQSGIPIRCHESSVMPLFNGLHLLDQHQELDERIKQLKPLLHQNQAQRLVLIDDFLTASAPGENYALGQAVLKKLNLKHSLSIVTSHQPLFGRLAEAQGPIRKLALRMSSKGSERQLDLAWDETHASGLLELARLNAWPADLLKQAESTQKSLQSAKKKAASPTVVQTPAKKTKLAAKPSPVLHAINADVKVGSWVHVPFLNVYGELQSTPDRKHKVQILCQGMSLEVSADQVVLSSHRKEKKHDVSGVQIQTWSVSSEACDLHGYTVDQALPILDKFLDTAYYQGLAQVRVVHGKGTSALRKAVHQHLQETSYIKRFRLGHPGEGDSGVTIVDLI